MAFVLHCGYFHPELEIAFLDALLREVEQRREPLRDEVLVVTPTSALRRRLLEVVSARCSGPLYGTPFTSIHPLCLQMAALSSIGRGHLLPDSLYYAFLIQKLAGELGVLNSPNLRISRAIYQTIRDLQDGCVSPELLQDVVREAGADPETYAGIHAAWLEPLVVLYRELAALQQRHGTLNLSAATQLAAEAAPAFVSAKRITSILVYGFYDATEAQFAVIENLLRAVAQSGNSAQVFFPFTVEHRTRVKHPDQYAQPFLDRLQFLNASLGGSIQLLPRQSDGASAGWERSLFTSGPEPAPEIKSAKLRQLDLFAAQPEPESTPPQPKQHQIEIFSSAGEYDEAWSVAKKILSLVLDQDVAFDQILVITRSGTQELTPLLHVLRENKIPSDLVCSTLAHHTYAKFAHLLLEARETALSPALLMEVLSSPFLPDRRGIDFRQLADLMENLLIRSWDDWDRLEPLLRDDELPVFYSFLEDVPPLSLQLLRSMVERILKLKAELQRIPERGSLPEFALALEQVLSALNPGGREARCVHDLLLRIAGYTELHSPPMTLPGFIDVFRMYLQETAWEPEEARFISGHPGVRVSGIMHARGVPADYVFVVGLNRDIFPRRSLEDPFLPDAARRALRELTGAGPAEKRSKGLLPLKEGTDEELLLFSTALRCARKRLFLSYRRADENGRKSAISNYLDELLRLITGKTSEKNDFIRTIPRHHASKFASEAETPVPRILPTLTECEALPALCAPIDALKQRGIGAEYAAGVADFAMRMNHTDPEKGKAVDGIIEDAARLWNQLDPESVTISYSRLKHYLQCPFQFFSRNVLHLQESPRDPADEGHDLDARLKGRMAEDIVKGALQQMKHRKISLEDAVDIGVSEVRSRYSALLPPVLLDSYMRQFAAGALQLLGHLLRNGYDLAASETPQYADMMLIDLLPAAGGLPVLRLRGIPDLLLTGRDGGLIGELKWGSKSVGKSPGVVFGANEAQFCTYPELIRMHRGVELPFQYFRLDVFAAFGDPDSLMKRIHRFPIIGGITKENAVRIFGVWVDFKVAADNLEKIKASTLLLRSGEFRIVKEPSLPWGPCRHCSYTQICRRSHTETLLRAKRAESE